MQCVVPFIHVFFIVGLQITFTLIIDQSVLDVFQMYLKFKVFVLNLRNLDYY